MRHAVFALLATAVLTTASGCSALHGIFIHGSACDTCGEAPCESCGETASCESCGESSCAGCGTVEAADGVAPASYLGHLGCRSCGKALPPPAGPPAGSVTYPYYTTRGPRDFLSSNPPSIGR